MPSILSASLDEIPSHSSICPVQPQFEGFGSGSGQLSCAKTFPQKQNNNYHNTQGATNAFLKRQEVFSALPIYFRQWLATTSEDEENDGPPPTADQEFMDTHNGYPRPTHGRSSSFPEEPACSSERFQLLEAELASFASKYLNLDYGTPGPGDKTTEGETGSPSISSDTTTLTGISDGVETPWEFGPTSVTLLDTTKFEFGMDANGSATDHSWPWGTYVCQSPSPSGYFNPEEYLREHQIRKWEEKLNRRMTKFYEERMLAGKRVKPGKQKGERREKTEVKGKGKEVEGENLPQMIAFSGVIRGRTIYNP